MWRALPPFPVLYILWESHASILGGLVYRWTEEGIMVIQRTITQRILEHLRTNCLSIVRPIKLKNYKIIFGWKLNSTYLSSIDDINFKPKLVAATSLKTVDYCSSALGWSSKKLTSGDSGDVGSFQWKLYIANALTGSKQGAEGRERRKGSYVDFDQNPAFSSDKMKRKCFYFHPRRQRNLYQDL